MPEQGNFKAAGFSENGAMERAGCPARASFTTLLPDRHLSVTSLDECLKKPNRAGGFGLLSSSGATLDVRQ